MEKREMNKELLKKVEDADLYEETARRLKETVEKNFRGDFSYGEVTFVFHAGHFFRIDCKPSLRAYLNPRNARTTNGGRGGA